LVNFSDQTVISNGLHKSTYGTKSCGWI
jgi:hypothetical protein